MKILDLNKNIKDICTQYPELLDILSGLGFVEITKPGMLNTVGKFMTLPKGAKMRGVELDEIIKKLQQEGFTVIGS